jgi:hypothetical protein
MITGPRVTALDFDGVLNNGTTTTLFTGELLGTAFQTIGLDPDNVAVFNNFQKRADTKIVVSSSWRWGRTVKELAKILKDAGVLGEVIGATPQLGTRRGTEIQAWLDANPPVSGLVIFDDDQDMEHLEPWLVRTSPQTGIRKKHVQLAHKVLARPIPGTKGGSASL